MRHWLGVQQICHHSFAAFVEESNVLNVTRFAEPGTIFVTALREPIARIMSSFVFEGSTKSFGAWVDEVSGERTRGRPTRVWMEVQNYYTQRLSGVRWRGKGPSWPEGRSDNDRTAPDWSKLYERALVSLRNQDWIFIMESFDNSTQMAHGAAAVRKPAPALFFREPFTPVILMRLRSFVRSLALSLARSLAETDGTAPCRGRTDESPSRRWPHEAKSVRPGGKRAQRKPHIEGAGDAARLE
jgi:hypothetical protein